MIAVAIVAGVILVIGVLLTFMVYKFDWLLSGRDEQGRFGGYPDKPEVTRLERIKEDYALGKISYAMLLFTIERELAFQTPPLPEPPKLPLPALPKPQEITVPAPDPARVACPSILARVQQYQRENAPHE